MRFLHHRTPGMTVPVGTPNRGTGTYHALVRLAADRLGRPLDTVSISPVGSDDELIDAGVGASSVTHVTGHVCRDACERRMQALKPPEVNREHPAWWIARALTAADRTSLTVHGEPEATQENRESVEDSCTGITVQTHVDPQTGVRRIQRALLAIETGWLVDPVEFRGQIEGEFVHGLSQSPSEHLIVEDGQPVTTSLGDYTLACIADVPPLEIRHVHCGPEPDDEIRAIGELTNLGGPVAIANSIDDAVGVQLIDLPMTAESIWSALQSTRWRP